MFQEILRFGFFHSVEKNDPKSLVYTNIDVYNKDYAVFTGQCFRASVNHLSDCFAAFYVD